MEEPRTGAGRGGSGSIPLRAGGLSSSALPLGGVERAAPNLPRATPSASSTSPDASPATPSASRAEPSPSRAAASASRAEPSPSDAARSAARAQPGPSLTEPSASRAATSTSRDDRDALRALPGTALYLHLPFCAAKCHYCDFFSVPDEGQDRRATIDAILHEAELRAPAQPRTVFLGGGTPSLFDVDELRVLLDGLQRVSGFRDSAIEVTAECNPESLDREKARALLDLGVTRLSIGFQSLHDEVLQLFGRVHSVEQSFRAYDAARAAGANDVNIDMIYAVPEQTCDAWERDLARVLALAPNHLSAYNLTFEEETVFKRWLDQGRLARRPEDVELEMFETTRALTASLGFEAYEISNFATRGRRCAHNVNYWENGAYVGIGPSAVSKIGHTRCGNVKVISAYARRVHEEGGARAWEETPTPFARLAETWWLGLRLVEGITAREARARAGFDAADDPLERVALRLVEQGLLQRAGERFALTRRGLPLADYVAKQFLAEAGEDAPSASPTRANR